MVNDEGEIVTNAHVVTDASRRRRRTSTRPSEVYVEFGDRNQVAGGDRRLRPVRRRRAAQGRPRRARPASARARATPRRRGRQPVAAIGSPFGEEQSLSIGIVSATERSIESLTQFQIDGAIQTDASINPGNSGGPLLDADGEVIGINQQINTPSGANEGVGFAVPINLVERSVDQLREDGEAEYAYIGVKSQRALPAARRASSSIDTDRRADLRGRPGRARRRGRAARAATSEIRFQGAQVRSAAT